MPNGPRIRANNVYGVITDDPLTPAAGTFNSDSLPLLPVVISAHAIVVLDPKRVHGDPEIVVVTAHTVSSTVATITRGQYGTSTRQHPFGTAWAHVPVDEDWTEIFIGSARPFDPYRGQMIFDYDTNKFVARSTLDVWQDVVALDGWQTWTPTFTAITIGAGTTISRFTRMGRTIRYQLSFTLGAGSAIASGPDFTLPTAPAAFYLNDTTFGVGTLLDTNTNVYPALMNFRTGNTIRWRAMLASGTHVSHAEVTSTVPFTWGSGDTLSAEGTYEASV